MFVLVTYDVNITSPRGPKRLRSIAKTCLNYGKRVQNSVFECLLTESQFIILKNALLNVIDKNEDSIRFYLLGDNWKRRVETIGKSYRLEFDEELVI